MGWGRRAGAVVSSHWHMRPRRRLRRRRRCFSRLVRLPRTPCAPFPVDVFQRGPAAAAATAAAPAATITHTGLHHGDYGESTHSGARRRGVARARGAVISKRYRAGSAADGNRRFESPPPRANETYETDTHLCRPGHPRRRSIPNPGKREAAPASPRLNSSSGRNTKRRDDGFVLLSSFLLSSLRGSDESLSLSLSVSLLEYRARETGGAAALPQPQARWSRCQCCHPVWCTTDS